MTNVPGGTIIKTLQVHPNSKAQVNALSNAFDHCFVNTCTFNTLVMTHVFRRVKMFKSVANNH